ncbi:conserved hypothetical protein [Gammaproteobacteria bacterium]
MKIKILTNCIVFVFLIIFPLISLAIEFEKLGFLTLAAGKKISSEFNDAFVVADYGQGGIYENNRWNIGPDSKIGLQGILTFNPFWSMTGQFVMRGARDGNINLEWLYATYQATNNLTLQFGLKRLPLFYYSEAQDIGVSLPWVRLPTPMYGWDVVNFRGANLIYRSMLGKWSSIIELFYGNEIRRDNPYLKIYNDRGTKWDEKWNHIHGADWTLNHDWLELRFSYVHSGMEYWDEMDKANTYFNTKQSFYSVATTVDYEKLLIRSEISKTDRPTSFEHYTAYLLGVGYRVNKWLPMITFSRFQSNYDNDSPNERFNNLSFLLRYDLSPSSAIKAQYDIFNDKSEPGVTSYNAAGRYGDAKMFSIAYDMTF